MGNSCCQTTHPETPQHDQDPQESHLLEKRKSIPVPAMLDINEHANMSVGLPSPDAASSPLGKMSRFSPSGRSIKVVEPQPASLFTSSAGFVSHLTSITAYDALDNNYPMKPSKEFISKVPEKMWHLYKTNAEFKFRLEEYSGSDNPIEFSKDDDEGKYYYGQTKKVMTNISVMQGKGYFCLKDSQLYVGYLDKDLPEGPGVMIYKDGSYFRGIWKKGFLNGFGVYYGPDGRSFKGNWVNNLQEGYGVETWKDNTNKYSGYFKRGKRCGQGYLEMGEDGTTYKGEFEDNVISGVGLFTWNDGKTYEGQWKQDKMHGKGIFKWPDEREYEGNYKHGKKDGFGVFRWPDGRKYEGYWKRGLQNGQGTYVDADGIKKSGFWLNGIKSDTNSLSTYSPGTNR